jgi:hypothetical protein
LKGGKAVSLTLTILLVVFIVFLVRGCSLPEFKIPERSEKVITEKVVETIKEVEVKVDPNYFVKVEDNLGVPINKEAKGFVKDKVVIVFPNSKTIQKALVLSLPEMDLNFFVSSAVYDSIEIGALLNISYSSYSSNGNVFYLVDKVTLIN